MDNVDNLHPTDCFRVQGIHDNGEEIYFVIYDFAVISGICRSNTCALVT